MFCIQRGKPQQPRMPTKVLFDVVLQQKMAFLFLQHIGVIMSKYVTAETVSPGHPDKIADLISDYVLTKALESTSWWETSRKIH